MTLFFKCYSLAEPTYLHRKIILWKVYKNENKQYPLFWNDPLRLWTPLKLGGLENFEVAHFPETEIFSNFRGDFSWAIL